MPSVSEFGPTARTFPFVPWFTYSIPASQGLLELDSIPSVLTISQCPDSARATAAAPRTKAMTT